MIEEAKKETELDYLQVFELNVASNKDHNNLQEITHRQEQPEYSRKICVPVKKAIKEKIFVINNTMLLSSEY